MGLRSFLDILKLEISKFSPTMVEQGMFMIGGPVMISFVGGPDGLGGPDFLWGDLGPLCTPCRDVLL